MSVVQPFYRTESYDTLRTTEDTERSVFWCHMHANLVASPGRACFSTQLVDDILDYQRNLGARLRLESNLRRATSCRTSCWRRTTTCSTSAATSSCSAS